jgi:hypothetical protein
MADATVQPKVHKSAGGDRLNVKEDGYLNFNDQDFTGAELRLLLLSPITRNSVTLSTDSKLAVSTIVVGYGYTALLQTTAASTCSLKLPSAEKGAHLFIDLRAWQSDLSIMSGAGSMVMGNTLSSLSCIMIVNGSVNSAWLRLDCFTEGQWCITNQSTRVGVQPQVAS